jgi:radical SAM protein with 4Fe4S-binding SPASM domain
MQFIQRNKISTSEKTADFLYEYFQKNPIIFGMHMEVTSRCNEKCIHCYQTRDSKHTMDLSLAKNVMDQLNTMGTVSLTISGGEPFLHPQFLEILTYARNCDFVINILTNGTHIHEEMIRELKNLNISMIQLSLYSMNEEIHDSITQIPGSHKRTMNSIDLLLEANIPIQISSPIMKANKDSYVEISKWCHNKKIRVLSDFIMMAKTDFDRSNLENRLNISETEELINNIIDVEEEYQTLLELEPKTWNMEHYKNMPVCGVGIDNACITAEGDLYPCSGFTGYKLGNARSDSLLDIWLKSEKVISLRKIKNQSFPGCLYCDARDYCAMCLVRNYNENDGNMFTISKHYCQVSFLTKDLVEKYRTNKKELEA